MALFRRFLGPYSPKYGAILPTFLPEVTLQQTKNIVWKEIDEFMKKRRTQSLHFWSNFDHTFPTEDGRNKKI